MIIILYSGAHLLLAQHEQDDLLIVDLPYFRIEMSNFYEGECDPGDSYSDLHEDLREEFGDVDLEYLLWDYLGPFGSVFGEDLFIQPHDSIYSIISVAQQYSTTLHFNEDGSGGVWTHGEIPELSSEWMEIEELDPGHYRTLTEEMLETTKPRIPREVLKIADAYINEREIPTTYEEYTTTSSIRIIYAVASDTATITLHFWFQYGD
jgi:hypothetical protein